MGRFGSEHHGGRIGRGGPPRSPKYLSVPPPKLQFQAPNLQTNKFFALRNQFSDTSLTKTIEIVDETNDYTTNNSSTKRNAINTFFNQRSLSRNKLITQSELTVTTTNLSPLIPNYPTTTSPIWKNSHNSKSPINQTSPTIVSPTNMSSVPSDTVTSSSTDVTKSATITPTQDVEMSEHPTTPTRQRRNKKCKATSPNTPSKKATRNSSSLPSPPPPHDPTTLSALSTDEDIDKMQQDYLCAVLLKSAQASGHAVETNTFKSLAISVLRVRAKAHRDALKTKPTKTKNVLVPIIKFDTTDAVINSLNKDLYRATYISCMRKTKRKIERSKLNKMSTEDFKKGIFEYRKMVTADAFQFDKTEDFTLDSELESKPSASVNSETVSTNNTTRSTQATPPITPSKPSATPLRDVPIENTKIKTPPPPPNKSMHADVYTTEKIVDRSAFITTSHNKQRTIKQYVIVVRTKFYRQYADVAFSDLAKIIIRLVRTADNTMNVIHFENEDDDGIDHEDKFPTDSNEIKKYLTATKVESKSKQFSIKFKVSQSITSISKEVVGHMAQHKNYATVDTLGSKRISCLGFWTVLHPDAHNRRRLKSICETDILATTGKNIPLSIYSRGITHGKGNEKAESRVIVAEVNAADAQITTDALMDKTFFEYEGNCKFIPFMKMNSSYNSTIAKLLQQHADHVRSTERINIGDLFLGTVNVRFITETFKTLKSLLLSFNTEEKTVIHDIDYAPNGSTNIIYNIKYDTFLESFLSELPQLLSKHVHAEDIPYIYHNKIPISTILCQRRVTNSQLTFWENITESLETNPQDPSSSYAAAASRHTMQPQVTSAPSNTRLRNMEKSVTSIKQEYVSKQDVIKLIQDHAPAQQASITTTTIQQMINSSIKEIPPPPDSLSKADILRMIKEQTATLARNDHNLTDIQTKIDVSISSLRDEFDTSQKELAKSVLAMSTTATNLQASVTALQNQNKHLVQVILKKEQPDPAISPSSEAGAKI